MILLLSMVMLAACAQQPSASSGATGTSGAAGTAQGDTHLAAASSATPQVPTVTPSPAPSPAEPNQPRGLPDEGTSVAEQPVVPDSPQGAAKVVQSYYAMIEGGKYSQAWLLWAGRGAASGMSVTAFEASFAKYRDYQAAVGAPGREDAGAGQRYVSVPVQVHARLKTGAPADLRGQVVLHRTADIDGATAEDKTWRIRSINLKPAPAANPK
ncbi:hypothetical protein [Sphingomonas sp.]|uniref:hypothetical protein n=1 Tax=Sphingomonas sp. TaxID=28214 RepID=UPI002E371D62|nr:hypothetical protein [Sphingomonas sp.]HEX4694946.1 hypothetical protein [Sphingomonas sp.]